MREMDHQIVRGARKAMGPLKGGVILGARIAFERKMSKGRYIEKFEFRVTFELWTSVHYIQHQGSSFLTPARRRTSRSHSGSRQSSTGKCHHRMAYRE